MTLSEFRSWLDGFSEAIDGAPNAEQWEKIKAKLATVKDDVKVVPNPFPPSPLRWSDEFRRLGGGPNVITCGQSLMRTVPFDNEVEPVIITDAPNDAPGPSWPWKDGISPGVNPGCSSSAIARRTS